MKALRYALIALALLAFSLGSAFAQTLQVPGNLSVSGTTTLTGTTTATGGVVNGCLWTVTTFGGAAAQTQNLACLANFNHVALFGANSGGTPTAVITPGQAGTTPQLNVNCAITASGSTTVACLAPAGQSTLVVTGFAW